MGDDNTFMRQRVGDEPVVGDLKKCGDSSGLIILVARPVTDSTEKWQDGIIWLQKESIISRLGPLSQFVLTRVQFVRDLLDTRHLAGTALFIQPLPKRWAEIKAIMEILGLDKDVCIEKVIDYSITPTSRPRLFNVSVLEIPSIRKASR